MRAPTCRNDWTLYRRVSSLPSLSSPIIGIEKMEGGFNKASLITAQNGREVVTRSRVR
ncbi:hypothetical protein BJX96DRAFT_149868 [Aspergillus floccosus]